MFSIAERRFGFFRVSPEELAKKAEEKTRKKEQKRVDNMHYSLLSRAGSAGVDLKRELENIPLAIVSAQKIELEFVVRLGDIESSVAERYSANLDERADNARLIAVSAYKAINLQLSHPQPPKEQYLPSFKRARRAAMAWGLIKTQEFNDFEIEMAWSVDFLGKALGGSLTNAELDRYLADPPEVAREVV